jgi:hypothetical protein
VHCVYQGILEVLRVTLEVRESDANRRGR